MNTDTSSLMKAELTIPEPYFLGPRLDNRHYIVPYLQGSLSVKITQTGLQTAFDCFWKRMNITRVESADTFILLVRKRGNCYLYLF